LGGFLYFKPIR